MIFNVDDTRIAGMRPLLPPAILIEDVPLSEAVSSQVAASRDSISRVFGGEDDRLVVVTGPCSIHDVDAAIEYAERLKPIAEELGESFRDCTRIVEETLPDPGPGEVLIRHNFAGVNGVYDQMMCLSRCSPSPSATRTC